MTIQLHPPPGIMQPQRRALEEASRALEAEFAASLISIVVGGSVGRGTARAGSDLDLFVLTANGWQQRRRSAFDGIEVDMFLENAAGLGELIRAQNNAVRIGNYATGWIAWDPDGVAAAFAVEASKLFACPRAPLSPHREFAARAKAKDAVHSVSRAAAAGDAASAEYLTARVVVHCIDAYYLVRRIWDPPPKARMEMLASADPVVHALAGAALDSRSPLPSRSEASRSLAVAVFGADLFESETAVGPKTVAL